jgi:3-phosphoshikimate 1-carboxyvinyltransferase
VKAKSKLAQSYNKEMTIKTTKTKLAGEIFVPGDKSVSHRALMFAVFSHGTSRVTGLSPAQDCQSTMDCLRQLGLDFSLEKNTDSRGAHAQPVTIIHSPGIAGLKSSGKLMDAGNSGTTIRLLSGICAGLPFESSFDGDESLRKRPMARVLQPLAEMGAKFRYEKEEGKPPFVITGGHLQGHDFILKVASAQVETALLLAGLQASGRTSVQLPHIARDHTQRMFQYLEIPFERDTQGKTTVAQLSAPIAPYELTVPGDISSAAFFMVAASCLEGSNILLKNVGFNPGRTLIFDVLKEMEADVSLENVREQCGEPVADIRVRGVKRLKGATISGEKIASGVDEIPILALAGSLCDGQLKVTDASELRHKESDRLALIAQNIAAIGGSIQEFDDGFIISGQEKLNGGGHWQTKLDHRLAMSGLVAQLLCQTPPEIEEIASAGISYPQFKQDFDKLVT